MPNTIPAAGEAMPKKDLCDSSNASSARSFAEFLTQDKLDRFSMKDLAVVMDATVAARDAVTGIANQPRCAGESEDLLEDFRDGLNTCISFILNIAEGAKPTTIEEAKERAYIILHHATWAKEDVPFFDKLFARLKREMAPFMEGTL